MTAMAKASTQFLCRECGSVQPKWLGKCPDCGAWNTLESYTVPAGGAEGKWRSSPSSAQGASSPLPGATPLHDVQQPDVPRLSTGIGELDRVLGESTGDGRNGSSPVRRGLVPGSVVLVGGDPGIGKSTLMLQAADKLAAEGHKVLYVSSEESAAQTRLRAVRLGLSAKNLLVLAETHLARILEQVRKVQPDVVIIDSIQMIYRGELDTAPGSVAQLRACGMELVMLAKTSNVAMFLVGHVTKQGQLAGPRLLEHMVDTVLYFEGDRYHGHRIVRAVKNRFGTTLEVGLFEMTEQGLAEVASGRGLLAAEYRPTSGSVVCPVLQGSRCVLVEVQALTATGFLGSAKRKTSGLDPNRLTMLIAVLEKRGGLRLADQDVFASSAGGLRVVEPAADLALALAIAGAHLNRTLPAKTCVVGEIGLGGEVRRVQRLEQRITEARRLGFEHVIGPAARGESANGQAVRDLSQAMTWLS
ncbi:MAG: DNA repair protein RadA [Phycisphaeraceae bacterium]|nr:DNA repair protein RadA [Phycisphaeraceae bacterium]